VGQRHTKRREKNNNKIKGKELKNRKWTQV
jgi:hypothetical protein